MRLIDAEKLRPDTTSYNTCGWPFTSFSEKQIYEAPTVEAIPIEWLGKWMYENCGEDVGEFYNALLEDWFTSRG